MGWWIWILIGVVLLAAELATPGVFFLFFFGIGAVVVGLIVAVLPNFPDWLQWFLFPVISIVSLYQFRGTLLSLMQGRQSKGNIDTLVGEQGVTFEEINVDESGKVELRGSSFSAKNIGSTNLNKGESFKVIRVEGLTLQISGL